MRLKYWRLFLLLLTMFFIGCTKPQDKILGTWKTVSGGKDVYFTFQKDNNLNVNNEIFVHFFVTSGGRLILGLEEPVPFSIKGNTLRIEQEGHTLTYTRVK
ncbi:MAG: hypothetical protein LBD18_06725 [Treponema sp.]|jgi:hypothetical protein|nr:hypothetical protein [Treponema sp.]